MKYKVGDTVKIKNIDWYDQNKDRYGDITGLGGVSFLSEMQDCCGKIFKIDGIRENFYVLEGSKYVWTDKMIECKVEDKLDLTEILKNCPKGTPLYSPVYGKVTLCDVEKSTYYPIAVKDLEGCRCYFSHYGELYAFKENVECVLFPSKENRDWSTFKAPRWRAEKGGEYYYVTPLCNILKVLDLHSSTDDKYYRIGNYFQTEKEAWNKAEEMKQFFKE